MNNTHLEKALAILKIAIEERLPTSLLSEAIREIESEIVERRKAWIETVRGEE